MERGERGERREKGPRMKGEKDGDENGSDDEENDMMLYDLSGERMKKFENGEDTDVFCLWKVLVRSLLCNSLCSARDEDEDEEDGPIRDYENMPAKDEIYDLLIDGENKDAVDELINSFTEKLEAKLQEEESYISRLRKSE